MLRSIAVPLYRFIRRTRRSKRTLRIWLALLLIIALSIALLLPGTTVSTPHVHLPHAHHRHAHHIIANPNAAAHAIINASDASEGQQWQGVGGEEDDGSSRSKSGLPAISAVVLFHAEYPTLNHTLHSWHRNDLVSHVGEILFFLNGVRSEQDFRDRLPYLNEAPWKDIIRVVPSPDNLKLGLAINRMVQLAKYNYVLLLEKDWALIENSQTTHDQLQTSISLLNQGTAQVVRYRHRKYPGAPLHARMMHENRELQMLQQQSNLYCYLHHWVHDPTVNHSQYVTRCPGTPMEQNVWCSKAKYCQWTNNPALFKRSWFIDEIGTKFVKDFNEIQNRDPNAGMLDFEFYMNWKADVWNDRDFVVALPVGLFEHNEVGEQNLMNTVWYAWNRLKVDVEEKLRDLFTSENNNCQTTTTKSLDSGPTFAERFPIDFVRHYSYNQSMTRTVSEAVAELHAKNVEFSQRLEQGHGSWRNGVTDLTNFWYTICLYAYPSEPKDMKLGFVTALYEDEHADKSGSAMKFADQVSAAAMNINTLRDYGVMVYTDEEGKNMLRSSLEQQHMWDDASLSNLDFRVQPVKDFLTAMLSEKNYERIDLLRATSDEWTNVVKERSNGRVPTFQELAMNMAKPYVMDEAVRYSEQNSDMAVSDLTHFVWFDAASGCISKVAGSGSASGSKLSPQNDHVFRGHIMLQALLTGIRLPTEMHLEQALQGSGFAQAVLLREMNKREVRDLHFADMRTIAGSKMALVLMKGYYDVVLRNMLRMNQLGTGREALTIAWNNVQYNFRFFDAVAGCPDVRNEEHTCRNGGSFAANYMSDRSSGCKIYEWAGSCKTGL